MIGDYSYVCNNCGRLISGNWLITKIGLVFGFFLAGFLVGIFWILAVISVFFGNGPPGCSCTQQSGNDK